MANIEQAVQHFQQHYSNRFGSTNLSTPMLEGITEYYYIDNPDVLKQGNGPRILYHGRATDHVIVLTHGLSDSPFYLLAVAKHFFRAGCNVVMTLLPAHGLIDPDKAMEDKALDSKWKECLDNGVETAQQIGGKISIGGFSTGGALSLNKILRDPDLVDGGLFLFSGALSVGGTAESAGRVSFVQSITKLVDGKLLGIGQDPYKYPRLPNFAGLELVQIINENNSMLKKLKITQPVMAAHSINDVTALSSGITSFIESHVEKGAAIFISENVAHAHLPLDQDVPLDLSLELGPDTPPIANPQFDWMMKSVLDFFKTI